MFLMFRRRAGRGTQVEERDGCDWVSTWLETEDVDLMKNL